MNVLCAIVDSICVLVSPFLCKLGDRMAWRRPYFHGPQRLEVHRYVLQIYIHGYEFRGVPNNSKCTAVFQILLELGSTLGLFCNGSYFRGKCLDICWTFGCCTEFLGCELMMGGFRTISSPASASCVVEKYLYVMRHWELDVHGWLHCSVHCMHLSCLITGFLLQCKDH